MTTPDVYVRLLGEIRDHLTAPRLCSRLARVQVIDSIDGAHASVQLYSLNLDGVAGGLLEWADTLLEVTASAWRPPSGESVHLIVTGRLGDGMPVQVYGAVPYTVEVFGDDLQPGGQQSLALSVLRTWATGAVAA